MCSMSFLITALAVMLLMPVVLAMDVDAETNNEAALLCAAAAAAENLVLGRRMLKTVMTISVGVSS